MKVEAKVTTAFVLGFPLHAVFVIPSVVEESVAHSERQREKCVIPLLDQAKSRDPSFFGSAPLRSE
jgi:hypothetical protein